MCCMCTCNMTFTNCANWNNYACIINFNYKSYLLDQLIFLSYIGF